MFASYKPLVLYSICLDVTVWPHMCNEHKGAYTPSITVGRRSGEAPIQIRQSAGPAQISRVGQLWL